MRKSEERSIFFLHGWAIDKGIYKNIADNMADFAEVNLLDLPGYAAHNKHSSSSIADICGFLSDSIPAGSIVVAWSMAALPAIHLAATTDRVGALCMLAASPCFHRKEGWGFALDPKDMEHMENSLINDRDSCIHSFCTLAAHNSPRWVLRKLRSGISSAPTRVLRHGLELLAHHDARDALAGISCQVEVVLGELDPLVPVTIAPQLRQLQPDLKVHIFNGCGHVPFLSHEAQTMEVLYRMTR